MGSEQLTDGTIRLRPWLPSDAPAIVECIAGDAEMAVPSAVLEAIAERGIVVVTYL